MHKNFTLFYLYLFIQVNLFSQINLTQVSPTYSQNFDGLPSTGTSATWTNNTTLANWYSSKTTIYVSDGSTTTGGLYSFGVSASTNRSLGSEGSTTSGTFYYAVKLKNNDATDDIVALDVSFIGEQWREGTTASVLEFQYQIANFGVIMDANTPTTGWTADAALDFADKNHATAQALNGDLSTNQTPKSSNIVLTATPGQEIWLRWKLIGGSNKCGLGIDNLSITANYPSGCSAPSTQASNLTFTSLTPYNYTVGWTNGNGLKRLLIGKESSLITDPVQNTDYSTIDNSTWSNYPSNEMAPASSDIRVLYDDVGNFANVSALQAETKYCFSIFEYLGSHCYNLSKLTGCRYTLSTEPTINTATLTANVISATQIDLNFTSMATVGLPSTKHGYIILQKTNSTPTEIPLDGNGYNIGDVIGTAKVAAIITDASDIATSITGLLSSTQYCFTIFSYRWNGSDSETINYLTPALVPSTCGLMLPVELLSFGGSCQDNNTIQLNWTTASEKDSKLFIVEKSTNGVDFIGIDSIAASGNSNTIKNYNYIDIEVGSNINYYRLKEIDAFNNAYIYKIVQINCEINNDIYSYFDAANNVINIELLSETYNNKNITISLFDVFGKIITQELKQGNNIKNKISLLLKKKLAKGIYILSISSNKIIYSKKIFIY